MKFRFYILIVCFGCLSCDTENINDCFQAEGNIVQQLFEVSDFSKIRIEDEVTLIIKQGLTQEVIIETGDNLLPEVSAIIEDETLVVRDGNTCNLVRNYGITKVFVTTPNLIEIRNSSAFDVISEGTLNFPELKLVSNTTGGLNESYKNGDFYLHINCDRFSVSANGQSIFYISGTTRRANLSFADEQPRFEGEDLIINDLEIMQRSANVMIVNPQAKITGVIRGTGDVISYNRPPIVDVEELFTGTLIFLD